MHKTGALALMSAALLCRPLYPDPADRCRVDFGVLDQYWRARRVLRTKHPTQDLYIWNYERSVNNHGDFDEVTMLTRALVTDGSGQINARSFPKFFDMGKKNACGIKKGDDFTVQVG